ncbi:tetratricopeptide repeat protein 1 [Prinia subflava]|uniref:tetratricopeptide repeat protein 1 n=1 Tax=Prinia subflava TaxID=208062 RepID=UPI002FDF69EF
MEEFQDASSPEELLNHLKLSEQQPPEAAPGGAQGCGSAPCPGQPPAEESFHDCHDSLEPKGAVLDGEGNVQEDGSSSRKQTELDEEYLLELEKDMPEEEKQKRRKESTGLKEKGNEHFKKGDYGEAEDSYSKALQICPACFQKDRAVLFSNRAAAKMKQDKTEAALSDCTKAVELDPHYVRALLRRAELYEKTEKLDEALEDYKAVLEKDPSVHQAREACMRLPQQIEERNEKLKKEMLGKLKDLGNLVLRPFGLSTENFQVKQDSSTGSYSINFVQNPNNNR